VPWRAGTKVALTRGPTDVSERAPMRIGLMQGPHSSGTCAEMTRARGLSLGRACQQEKRGSGQKRVSVAQLGVFSLFFYFPFSYLIHFPFI
jgi:hypothetical protein